MRIGVDARFLTHPQLGGFKTYTENLVSSLAMLDTENQYVFYTDRAFDDSEFHFENPNVDFCVVPNGPFFIGMPWREQVELSRRAAKDRIDIFHSPCLTAPLRLSCPLVVTIHDMIWAFPEKFHHSDSMSTKRKLMDWYDRIVPRYAIRNAAAIITVSNAAKESLIEHLHVDPKHIYVTYEAANSSFRKINDSHCLEVMRKRLHLNKEFILAIGSADPRKNIKTLVSAYGLLPDDIKEKYQLVIVWTHSFLSSKITKQVEELGLTHNVRFFYRVSRGDLLLLYNLASLFVFPSLYEGFGLPILEAMACGAPVIASDNSSIPEIVGDAGILFNAEDVQGISNAIVSVLTDDSLNSNLRQKGIDRAANFSWKRCAQETVAVYQIALG